MGARHDFARALTCERGFTAEPDFETLTNYGSTVSYLSQNLCDRRHSGRQRKIGTRTRSQCSIDSSPTLLLSSESLCRPHTGREVNRSEREVNVLHLFINRPLFCNPESK
jgi:hypothetical protein